jgi:hypothetical protein
MTLERRFSAAHEADRRGELEREQEKNREVVVRHVHRLLDRLAARIWLNDEKNAVFLADAKCANRRLPD